MFYDNNSEHVSDLKINSRIHNVISCTPALNLPEAISSTCKFILPTITFKGNIPDHVITRTTYFSSDL